MWSAVSPMRYLTRDEVDAKQVAIAFKERIQKLQHPVAHNATFWSLKTDPQSDNLTSLSYEMKTCVYALLLTLNYCCLLHAASNEVSNEVSQKQMELIA